MLSTDIKQESMVKKIENIVTILRSERPIFKKYLDYEKIVQGLVTVFQENLSFEEFNNVSEESLKNRCSKMMSVELLATIGDDFTPEEMAIFEDAIKRK
ncbi:hypothetical protein ACN4EE_00815 [Geminocystis sp. CENA526]|uniref:hypothetical protein n=1 Tax=Geminocystis sp. CENA526 TaxID=1355871 RepID=UPI003D6E364A